MKTKGEYNSKLKPLYTAFLYSIKFSVYRIGIRFDKDLLAVEQKQLIANIYIVYDLDACAKTPTNNSSWSLFGAIDIVKNSDKDKYVYRVYEIKFYSAGSWSFDNDTARNVIILSVDNSSSIPSDNRKNNFLVLGEDAAFGINGSLVNQRKKLVLILLK